VFKRGSRPLLVGLVGILVVALYACAHGSPHSDSVFTEAGTQGSGGMEAAAPPGTDSGSAITIPDATVAADAAGGDGCVGASCTDALPSFCGDGIIEQGESCDDGNSVPGDGCSGICQIEHGYACPTPGQPCMKIWVCGNGRIDPGETCDDGNTNSNDGCSSTCQVEPGYACSMPGSPCTMAPMPRCGDGAVNAGEQCDDGNTVSNDGCSSTCQVEPGYTCPNPGQPCKKIEFCGDGVVELDIGEQCDDGNTIGGDGCTALCQLEPNFVCPTPGQPCVSTVKCGDGKVQGSETCDDGNTKSNDGCSSTCQVEPGWQCPTPGLKCIAKQCGDGILAGTEQCDDGNMIAGDGCSPACQIEPGFACVASTTPPPASVCHKTVCGDGVKEGSEQCDDGNLVPYDGCSPTCTIDPKCNGTGGCTGVCGDGLVFPNEQCDDGNTVSGDGCSATCQLETGTGFTCTNVVQAPAGSLVIPILYRDVLYHNNPQQPGVQGRPTTVLPVPAPAGGGHVDFNCGQGHCVLAGGGSADTVSTGEVQTTLGADGKPVFASTGNPATLTDAVDFCWWYHDTGCGDGGANPFAKLVFLDLGGNPTTLTLLPGTSPGTYTYSNAQFFPVDGLGWNAGTNPQTDLDCEPNPPDGGVLTHAQRNFAFTSELHYIFTFDANVAASATPAVFNFVGDDDVWGFINNQLVIDLGGVHSPAGFGSTIGTNGTATPANGSFTLNTANAAGLGLVDQGWYQIDLFQSEAHVCRSTYALTLSNFTHVVTQCHTVCGDGIVAGNEQCDEGALNGTGYGHCTADCKLGPFCGDGILQSPPEQCDNGTNLTPYTGLTKPDPSNPLGPCAPGCVLPLYCGDGIVSNGEQCDEGALNGTGYGHCSATCTLGPRCGDGLVQKPQEQCDDGINNGSTADPCSANCMLKCGDGVVETPEQCDDGAANNTGGYGGCNPNCTRAPYCGDGIVQDPPEQCDNGINDGSYGTCNPNCTLAPYCGDGIVNGPELCDNAGNNVPPATAYGAGVCTTQCIPAPYCGDGIVQNPPEACDSTPGCNSMCQTGPPM